LNGRYSVEHIEFLELAKSYGCVFSLGSDSHDASTVGDLDFQEKLASSMKLEMLKISQ
jgi:histidinol phosphatase-like PHP family hydrolase